MLRPTLLLKSVGFLVANRHHRVPVTRRLPDSHRLRHEPLEDRRMLAAVTVTNDLDVVNGDTSSIANLIANDGGDGIALREAIDAANATLGPDAISFDISLSGGTILLGGNEFAITEALAIDATALAEDVTIDAQQNSRIINITVSTGDFSITGLTLTGGKTTGSHTSRYDTMFNGGAIRSMTSGQLTIERSRINGNSTEGMLVPGGAIYASGPVTLTASTVSDNSTMGDFSSGGAIYADDMLTLTDSTVSGNHTSGSRAHGGGIMATAATTLINATVSGNSTAGDEAAGGGIFASGDLTLTNSTVDVNYTLGFRSQGGGIRASRVTIITDSVISDNRTMGDRAAAGGIWALRDLTITRSTVSGNGTVGELSGGGGIWSAGVVTLVASTVSGNFTTELGAHGGGIRAVGSVELIQSTVTDNHVNGADASGGGIRGHDERIVISSSILSGNSAVGGGPDLALLDSSLLVDHSLIGDTSGLTIDQLAAINAGVGNLLDVDATLDALADNGGPTQTHALLPASPAIDAGASSWLLFDQRGAPHLRGIGAGSDMGSYEFGDAPFVPPLDLVVSTLVDDVDHDFTPGNLSLREAIGWADEFEGGDTITFAPALNAGTVHLALGELIITSVVSIDATSLAGGFTIDAGNHSRIVNIIARTGDFGFAGLTLTGGQTTEDNDSLSRTWFSGGAVRSSTSGNLVFDRSTLSGNGTQGEFARGGAIFAHGNVTATNSTISGNSTLGGGADGGGIFVDQGHVTLIQSTVSGNSTTGDDAGGGAVAVNEASITVSGSVIADNYTRGDGASGGALFALGDVTFDDSTLSGNHTEGDNSDGGGLYTYEGDVTIAAATISGNSTRGDNANGGAVFIYKGGDFAREGIVTLTDSTFDGNHTEGDYARGGGFYVSSRTVNITDSTFNGNETVGLRSDGGGIYQPSGTLTMVNSTVNGNSTSGQHARGGGVFSYTNLHLTNSTVGDNRTTGLGAGGGGIWSDGNISLAYSTVSGNRTEGDHADGGGIHSHTGSVALTHSTVSGNTTWGGGAAGGGIQATSRLSLEQSTLTDNHTYGLGSIGGGIVLSGSKITLSESIVAANTAAGGNNDIDVGFYTTFIVNRSLIGDTSDLSPNNLEEINAGIGNLLDVNPLLAPLADNGGPTQTHALLPGSPAIDAGFVGSLLFDQRGAPYLRVHGSSQDYGASEWLPADGDLNGVVDKTDYQIWADRFDEFPASDPPGTPANGDYNNDGSVDGRDYLVWVANFGSGDWAVPSSLVVGTLVDELDDDFSPTDLSLREAIVWANTLDGTDTITFDSSLAGGTIDLAWGELVITESLNIDATSLADGITIDAHHMSRVVHITTRGGDFTFAGLTLKRGRTVGDNESDRDTTFSGGGIRSVAEGELTIDRTTIIDSHTEGKYADGGAIHAGGPVILEQSKLVSNRTLGQGAKGGGVFTQEDVILTESVITGNSTAGNDASGGGVYSRSGLIILVDSVISDNHTTGAAAQGGAIYSHHRYVRLTRSIISGNSTSANDAHGGGISGSTVVLVQSTVSDNRTNGNRASGGGVYTRGKIILTESTVSDNQTRGDDATGGGIHARGSITLTNSTVSGNTTTGSGAHGGGVHSLYNGITILQSTVTDNHADGVGATAGGIWNRDDGFVASGSIIAANTANGGHPDVLSGIGPFETEYTLIGDTTDLTPEQIVAISAGTGNLLDVDPMLGPLVDNGGPTFTHALLPSSPAIDAGDPTFVGPPFTDQRGYYRVAAGRIDMGAFEYAAVSPLPGDGIIDGNVDGLDYLLWASRYGNDPAPDPPGSPANGDYNNDGVVDGGDYLVWADNFEATVPVSVASEPAAASGKTIESLAVSPSEQLAAVDLVLEDDHDMGKTVADSLNGPTWQTSWAFDLVLDRIAGKRCDHKRAWAAT